MPRHHRIKSKTGVYHIMLRGNERKNLFLDEDDKQRFLDTLFAKKKETGFSLYAYCLMDNHVHLLFREGLEETAFTIKRINISYAFYFNHKYKRVGHLFQDRFKSEPVEDDRYLLAAVRYIHNNPVKTGMVEDASHYKWSSYCLYTAKNGDNKIDTAPVLELFSDVKETAIQLFKDFMETPGEETFLDCDCETDEIADEAQAVIFLQKFALNNGIREGPAGIKTNKQLREKAILELRRRSSLSIRQIAEILGVNRGVVARVKS